MTPQTIRIWRDGRRRLWDEFEGGLMSLVDSPDGQLQNVDSCYVHTEFGPLALVSFRPWWACMKPGCDKPFSAPGDCPVHDIPLVEIGPDDMEVA